MYKLLLYKYRYRYRSTYCSVPMPILAKNAISVADILADPIIGTALIITVRIKAVMKFSTRSQYIWHQLEKHLFE